MLLGNSGSGQLKQVDGILRNQDQVRSAKGGRKFGGDSARRADTGKITSIPLVTCKVCKCGSLAEGETVSRVVHEYKTNDRSY